MNVTDTIKTPTITVPANDEISTEFTEKEEDPVVLGLHRGAIDQTTITTQPPCTVMTQVTAILYDMGLEIQKESAFKYRCVRAKKGSEELGDSQSFGPTRSDDNMLSPEFSPIVSSQLNTEHVILIPYSRPRTSSPQSALPRKKGYLPYTAHLQKTLWTKFASRLS